MFLGDHLQRLAPHLPLVRVSTCASHGTYLQGGVSRPSLAFRSDCLLCWGTSPWASRARFSFFFARHLIILGCRLPFRVSVLRPAYLGDYRVEADIPALWRQVEEHGLPIVTAQQVLSLLPQWPFAPVHCSCGCSEACARSDWAQHRPICTVLQGLRGHSQGCFCPPGTGSPG